MLHGENALLRTCIVSWLAIAAILSLITYFFDKNKKVVDALTVVSGISFSIACFLVISIFTPFWQ